MAKKVFKPQLKSDIFLNYNNGVFFILCIILGFIVFFIFYYVEHLSFKITTVISIFFILLFIMLFYDIKKRIDKWDLGGYTTIEINTESHKICFDKFVKLYTNQISYVDIIENELPSLLYGFKTYYSIVNVIMIFHLKDENQIIFNVHNATKLIEIINMLRKSGVNVMDSDIEYQHKDDIKMFWIGMATLVMLIVFILFILIYNS